MMMNSSSKCVVGLLTRRFSSLAVISSSSSTAATSTATSTATRSTANKSLFSTMAWKLNSMNIAAAATATPLPIQQILTKNQQQRTKVSNRKVIDAKNAKRLKIQQKKKKGNNNNLKVCILHCYITSCHGMAWHGMSCHVMSGDSPFLSAVVAYPNLFLKYCLLQHYKIDHYSCCWCCC
jgi:hypothetical protein